MHRFLVLAGLCYCALKSIGGKYTKLDQTRNLEFRSFDVLVLLYIVLYII